MQAGVLEPVVEGFEDDAALAPGIGFTDIVKRPTPNAAALTAAEKRHGVTLLTETFRRLHPPMVIFPFKAAAVELVGPFRGSGWLDRTFAGAQLFVMPGPYEATVTAEPTVRSLGARFPPSGL